MKGFRAVTMERLRMAYALQRSGSAVMPFTHFTVKTRTAFMRIVMESRSL